MAKGIILEKKASVIIVEMESGNTTNVTLYKRGTLFLKLSKLKVGDNCEFETDTYQGVEYPVDSNKRVKGMIEAKTLALEEIRLNRLMEEGL